MMISTLFVMLIERTPITMCSYQVETLMTVISMYGTVEHWGSMLIDQLDIYKVIIQD